MLDLYIMCIRMYMYVILCVHHYSRATCVVDNILTCSVKISITIIQFTKQNSLFKCLLFHHFPTQFVPLVLHLLVFMHNDFQYKMAE